jgi:hypothetical protein
MEQCLQQRFGRLRTVVSIAEARGGELTSTDSDLDSVMANK